MDRQQLFQTGGCMSYPHWEYFLSIEEDLARCTRYVDFNKDNYNTYSVEFARIIVAAAAEFDSVAKGLCKAINPAESPDTINQYYPIIVGKYAQFLDYTIDMPRFKLELQPWKAWTPAVAPDWWSKSYNKIIGQTLSLRLMPLPGSWLVSYTSTTRRMDAFRPLTLYRLQSYLIREMILRVCSLAQLIGLAWFGSRCMSASVFRLEQFRTVLFWMYQII
jgi:hypothetical protein